MLQDSRSREHEFHPRGHILHPRIEYFPSRDEDHPAWHNPRLHQAERLPEQTPCTIPFHRPAVESSASDDPAFHRFLRKRRFLRGEIEQHSIRACFPAPFFANQHEIGFELQFVLFRQCLLQLHAPRSTWKTIEIRRKACVGARTVRRGGKHVRRVRVSSGLLPGGF